MRFRNWLHRNQPPETPEERDAREARENLAEARENLAKAQEQLQSAWEARRDAGRTALSLADRRSREEAVHQRERQVAIARHALNAIAREPSEVTKLRQRVEAERQNTLDYGRQAAQLLRERFAQTGEDPAYTFSAAKVSHSTAQDPQGVPKSNVRGWLIFDKPGHQGIINYPTSSPHRDEWVLLYNGPVLLPNGEINAFYDYQNPLPPSTQPPPRPISLGPERELRTTEYLRYRGAYPPESPLEAEYATQQAIASLLDQHNI